MPENGFPGIKCSKKNVIEATRNVVKTIFETLNIRIFIGCIVQLVEALHATSLL